MPHETETKKINDRFVFIMDHLIESRSCRNYGDFWQQLGFENHLAQRTQKIKHYQQKITLDLLMLIGDKFNININYVLGYDSELFR